jgi:hypothetical protein
MEFQWILVYFAGFSGEFQKFLGIVKFHNREFLELEIPTTDRLKSTDKFNQEIKPKLSFKTDKSNRFHLQSSDSSLVTTVTITVVKQTPSAEGPEGYGMNHFFGSNYGRRLGEW